MLYYYQKIFLKWKAYNFTYFHFLKVFTKSCTSQNRKKNRLIKINSDYHFNWAKRGFALLSNRTELVKNLFLNLFVRVFYQNVLSTVKCQHGIKSNDKKSSKKWKLNLQVLRLVLVNIFLKVYLPLNWYFNVNKSYFVWKTWKK